MCRYRARPENRVVHTKFRNVVLALGALACLAGPGSSADKDTPLSRSAPPVQCLEQLARLSWCELEELYRGSAAGTMPHGFARGRVVHCPASLLAGPRSRMTRLLWHGKHFCADDGILVNQWLGFRAIHARVDYGPSWLDGKTSLILDYQGESRVWADVRDEMREVAPGLYVGAMYLRGCPEPRLKLFFCLEAQCPCQHNSETVDGGRSSR
jgi:hypothetical protein